MRKLSDAQVKHKLTESRNFKRLYYELKDTFDDVAAEHEQCPQLKAELTAIIETQAAQIAELQAKVKPKGGYATQFRTRPNPLDIAAHSTLALTKLLAFIAYRCTQVIAFTLHEHRTTVSCRVVTTGLCQIGTIITSDN